MFSRVNDAIQRSACMAQQRKFIRRLLFTIKLQLSVVNHINVGPHACEIRFIQ